MDLSHLPIIFRKFQKSPRLKMKSWNGGCGLAQNVKDTTILRFRLRIVTKKALLWQVAWRPRSAAQGLKYIMTVLTKTRREEIQKQSKSMDDRPIIRLSVSKLFYWG
jgi:hypothetical protein